MKGGKDMKKTIRKILNTILTLTLIAALAVTAFAAGLTADDAKAKALADAGFTENDVIYIKAQADLEDGIKVFDVEFLVKQGDIYREYDYEISAVDGAIREKSSEIEDDYRPGTQNPPASAQVNISRQRAIEIAAEAFGFKAADVKVLKAELDRDDGRVHYDIDFTIDFEAEYSCEVDAQSGEVYDKEFEIESGIGEKLERIIDYIIAWIMSLFIAK